MSCSPAWTSNLRISSHDQSVDTAHLQGCNNHLIKHPIVRQSDSCECDILRCCWGNVFKFGTNVRYDSSMNWSEFNGQMSKLKITVTSQNTFIGHNSILTIITIQFYTQMSDGIKWWRWYLRGQRLNALWHHNVLWKIILVIIECQNSGTTSWLVCWGVQDRGGYYRFHQDQDQVLVKMFIPWKVSWKYIE